MTICCLGDLVLDVIVRLEQPLAADADATSRIVLRPGGQAANVAAWVAALGGSARFVGKRGADDAGALAACTAGRARRRARRPRRARRKRGHRLPRRSVRRPDDVLRSGRRDRAPARRGRRRLVRRLRPPARLGVRAAAGPVRLRRPAWRSTRLGPRGARSASTSRRGARFATSAPSAFRATAPGDRSRRRLRERGRGPRRRRADRRQLLDSQARSGRRVVRRRGASRRSRSTTVVDSTGAGDAFAAGWLVGGRELALEAAARCVQRAGSMPCA